MHNGKPSILIRDMAKYYRVDPAVRVAKQAEWNRPVWWPAVLMVLAAVALGWIAVHAYGARQRATARPGARSAAARPAPASS